MSHPEPLDNEVAIIGMACRVAGADSPSKLWDILATSKDVRKDTTRFNVGGFYASDGGPQKGLTNVRQSYFIDGDVDRFDNGFFEISPLEANAMDPQQRLILEVTYEAVENAGIPLDRFRGTDTAVFAATTSGDYGVNTLRDVDTTQKYTSTGTSNAILANRLSYFFDLHGPSLLVDTACSSTMVALHYAVSSLKSGEADMAVVSGVNIILNPDMFVHMSELGFLSPSGCCRSFDAAGDGYARAEGVLSLLLKPLRRARQDGDPIRAVIKGTRLNQNGRTQGITLPSAEEQKSNLNALYQSCNIDPADIQYLEAHGTGTAAGDPLELGAIDSVFGPSHMLQKLVVGSVKSNIGHLGSCAALAGIIKTVECLERGLIPPQMHFETPNPKIDFSNIEVPTAVLPWPPSRNGIRTAGINSFGFGGTNGHAVLTYTPRKDTDLAQDTRPRLFKVSAANDSSLSRMAASYASYIESHQPNLADLSHTLLSRRTTLKRSMFIASSSSKELIDKLRDQATPRLTRSRNSSLKVGFIFTGQGAQWATMGKQLLEESPIFLSTVSECDHVLHTLPDAPSWYALEELAKPKETTAVNIASLSQPPCTILQIGLVELWKSWGITPDAVVGHSSGEVAAAYAAGILSLSDAVIVAYYRGLYLGSSTSLPARKGAMCAVGLSEADCQTILKNYPGRVSLAAVNSPSSCTLSGDKDAIVTIVEDCKVESTFCRMLRVDMAYHSHHMLPLAPMYENSMTMAGISPQSPPKQPYPVMFSSVYGGQIDPKSCVPAYWKENMISTVRFNTAVRDMMLQEGIGALVELGPHPALKGPVSDILADLGLTEVSYFSSCFRSQPDMVAVLESVGKMIVANMPINTTCVNAKEVPVESGYSYQTGQVLTDLPKYEWDHSSSFWAESRISHNLRFRQFPRHELLGSRMVEDSPLCMGWRNILAIKNVPWLGQIKDNGETILPPSLFILIALEAGRQVHTIQGSTRPIVQLKDVAFEDTFQLSWLKSEDTSFELHFILHGHRTFEVSALSPESDDHWMRLCTGTIRFLETPTQFPDCRKDIIHNTAFQSYVESFQIAHVKGIRDLKMDATGATGRMDPSEHNGYRLDPVMFTTLMQLQQTMMLGSGLPGNYQLRNVGMVETTLESCAFKTSQFLIDLVHLGTVAGTSSLFVKDTDSQYVALQAMDFEIDQQIQRKPLLESLFFKPQLLPDIVSSYVNACRERIPKNMTMPEVMLLITHKWPNSDIGLMDIDSTIAEMIISSIPGLREDERPRFRSLTVVGDYQGVQTSRLRKLQRLNPSSRFHMIFGTEAKLQQWASMLLPSGLVCVRVDSEEGQALFDRNFDRICGIQAHPSCTWVLGRARRSRITSSSRKLQVFSPPSFGISLLSEFLNFEHVLLPGYGVQLSDENNSAVRPKGVIVLDCGQESILATRPAYEWLPWLQQIIEHVETLLWVNYQREEEPFANVAGSFVRTLRAEYPALKAANLVFTDHLSSESLPEIVSEVYHDLEYGNTEVELVVKDGHLQCLRYLPDDQLNASVGLAPPTSTQRNLASGDYRIASTGKRRASIFLGPPARKYSLDADYVIIETQASIVDHSDALAFSNLKMLRDSPTGFGLFFAGIAVATNSSEVTKETAVVGWSPGAHQSSLRVPAKRLCAIPESVSITDAVTCFAACATAFAIVHGAARARSGDTFGLQVSGMVATAIEIVCRPLGAKLLEGHPKLVDFTVSFDTTRGLTLNDRPVSVCHYLETTSRMSLLLPLFEKLLHDHHASFLLSKIATFALPEFQSAFSEGVIRPLECVILHSGKERVNDALVDYMPAPKLFSDDGFYIILGGMGGIGQHLSIWMVTNGAKNIVTISRSGLKSAEAQKAASTVEGLGGQIHAFSVDVTNLKALDDAIGQIRQHGKIRGCLNLAMVLQDAPFMKMTSEMWDRALKPKVDGSWNLHQSTLKDDLDFFILFSSISSITGNRSQSNYATGNAFQNSLASYRRSLGLPGISIALGSMSGIGVLANDQNLLAYFAQMGHAQLGPEELNKVMEAAVQESQRPDCPSLICLGFQMFETLDGVVQKRPDQNQLFWTDFPEFGHLLDHKSSGSDASPESLTERLQSSDPVEARAILTEAFLECLGSLLGYNVEAFDPQSSIAVYGLDSLNAMSCRYWFFQQLAIDVPVFDVLGCKSIDALISRVIQKFLGDSQRTLIPQPVRNVHLQYRPLSHSQRRLWFLHKYLPDKTVYNLLLVCHIQGQVNVPAFRKAWTVLLQRHESLRSRLLDTEHGLQQIPVAIEEFPIVQVTTEPDEHQAMIDKITATARSFEFDLENGELVRGWLLQSPVGWRFFLASHHLAWDRSSVPTIFAETTRIYKSFVAGYLESSLDHVKMQFIDYTLWQEKCLQTPQFIDPLIRYWTDQLRGIPEAVSLLPMAITDKRPAVKQLQTDQVTLTFDSELGQSIKSFCTRHAVTSFMFMASALSALVHRLTADEDVIIGIADGDRGHSAFDELVGFTVNMLPIRSKTSPSRPFTAVLENYRRACLEAYEHRGMPFDFLLSRLEIPRRTSHSPVFQLTVNYQMHGSFPEYDYGDFKFVTYDHYNARQQVDLSLSVEETANADLDCIFEFDTAIYDRQGVINLAEIYRTFIGNIIASDGELPLDHIGLISSSDKDCITSQLEQLPDPGLLEMCDQSLFPILFDQTVSSHPEKIAVIDESRSVTWAEVDLLTKRIGNRLIQEGVRQGEAVGIFCEPSVDLVLAAWGIARAGCAYVPIDPDFPDERVLCMMEDVDMKRVLVDGQISRIQRMISCGLKLADVHEISRMTVSNGTDTAPILFRDIVKTDPFCCVFTSGSTGRPKGVYVGHGQLRYQQEGYNRVLGTTTEDRILLASAMVFDASLCAIYGTVLYGATMVVASREARYSPLKMVDLVVDECVSNCIFTPTQVKILLAAANRGKLFEWTSLKALALGGEPVPTHVIRDLYDLCLPGAAFFNAYGPTETTISASVAELVPEDAHRANVRLAPPHFPAIVYILDKKGNRAPIGVPGELWIGGAAVNDGYVKRTDLTEQTFLPNPFSKEGRIYRTGDLFCLARDGTLHARGRIGGDRQIKIRGMRVELDEIETALRGLYEDSVEHELPPLVHLAVVYHKKEETDGVLAAYLATGQSPLSSSLERSLRGYFRSGLKECLPIHMVPSAYTFLADLPTTVAGKTDYKTISLWPVPSRAATVSDGYGETFQLTEWQQGIVAIWKDVLDIDGEISADDDFFSLGGHSLLLMKVQSGIEAAYDITLSLAAMFAEPTVKGLERLLLSHREALKTPDNGDGGTAVTIDWNQEATLDPYFDWIVTDFYDSSTNAIAMTGASSMIGVHLLHLLLTTTENTVYCLAEDEKSHKKAHERVVSALSAHRLLEGIPGNWQDRLVVFSGSLTHETLGLTPSEVALLDTKAGAIYHMNSDVSLLKNYTSLRAGNVGALKFLISLAHGNVGNFKAIHYLSTWGVPHLQAWNGTKLRDMGILHDEQEMMHMEPDADCGLAYLKARWVCEKLLYEVARRGLPVTIYRPSMCGNSPGSGLGLKRTDINRRILESSLQTGLIPDFGSSRGGGMSWITSDFLAGAIAHLSLRPEDNRPLGKARIFHIVADSHIPYNKLADVLQVSHSGQKLRTASPEEWFAAMHAAGNPEMKIQAEVLREWWLAGWLPFSLDASSSRRVLSERWGVQAPVVDRQLLLQSVIGEPGF